MNLLITGAGSLIGHGILRSLREMERSDLKIFTADPDPRAVGHWLGDYGLTIPMAKNDSYIEVLKDIIRQHHIEVVFIGTDPELMKLSKVKNQIGATVVVSDPDSIQIGDDKWETVQFLKANDFPFPDSVLSENGGGLEALVQRVGFPLIAKPRIGARSSGLMIVKDRNDLEHVKEKKGYVVQELLSETEGEFTAGTMTYSNACYSCVIFRRDLKDGNTFRAYSYENRNHEAFLKEVSCKLPGVYGPLNFQYRLKNGKPVIFEINSRFSGTTPLRTAVGVNEIEMAINYIKMGKLEVREPTLKKIAIFRTWSDMIVPMDQVAEFIESKHLANPSSSYFPFKK
jgi:carbamoyl-phosphate synthase large subunit